ncbi:MULTISPECIES: ABC transporter permease [Allofournierella]|uniref:ABC transporter permease n=1 Tax=Allofournierella TaxID=1940255 RepID=UPI0015B1B5E3|nr:ABC transporter permease subunit [Fournierella sp.]MEE0756717.1 iron ABC transporter permease [Fournierella sp.]
MKGRLSDGRAKPRKDVWLVISVVILALYALFMIYPLFMLLRNAVIDSGGQFTLDYFVKFLSKQYYLGTVLNSFKVSISATILTMVIGVPLAYFYNMYEIKGARFLQIIIILCSMSAPFIGAYSWILLLGRNGLITNFVKDLTGIKLPSIYGFGGILLVLCLQLYPLVFLYVSGALKNVDNTLLEASENMGCTGLKRFFTVIIPLCAPTIIAAMLMVFMRAFADFGTPLFIGEGYRTFPVEIYNSFMSETGGDTHFASAVAVIAIIITAVIFLFQRFVNSKFQFTMNALHPIERKKAKGVKGVLIHLFCYGVVTVAYAPQLYVIYTSFQNTSGKLFVDGYSLNSYVDAFSKLGNAIPNTFLIGGVALIIIVALSILVAYLVVRRSNIVSKFIDTLSMVPYVIPGSVVGIALIMAFSSGPIVLVGTATIMIVALVIRRNSYTIRSSVATLQQIPMSIEEAAISLGSSKMKAFFKVTMPMMANGIISGALLSWIAIITELSTGILLYNWRTTTLTIQIYTYVSRGSYGVAAAMACVLTVMTTISLLIFIKFSKNKNITF